jgi:hypothetical protein
MKNSRSTYCPEGRFPKPFHQLSRQKNRQRGCKIVDYSGEKSGGPIYQQEDVRPTHAVCDGGKHKPSNQENQGQSGQNYSYFCQIHILR